MRIHAEQTFRIALINTLYPPYGIGGAERSVQLLAEALAARGHQVDVLTLYDEEQADCSLERGVRIHRLPVPADIHWPFGRRRYSSFARWQGRLRDSYNRRMATALRGRLAELAPQILHTNNLLGFSAAVWRAARELDIRVVHTCRDYYLFHPQACLFEQGRDVDPRSAAVRAWSLPRRHASRDVDVCVGVSRYILDLHRHHGFFPRAMAQVVYNGIGMPIEPCATPIPSGYPLRVGYLGRVERHKGVEVLLDALARCTRRASIELIVAGGGSPKYLRQLQAKHAALAPRFLGHVAPEQLFRQVDVLVVPSLWQEPFGRVVIESYAHGVPVLAASSGGIPEIVEDGRTGYLFARGDSQGLADLLDRLAAGNLPLDRLACLRYAERFVHAEVADRYEAIYGQLVQPRA